VVIRHIFEVEDAFFAKTVLSFYDYGPEDLAQGLFAHSAISRWEGADSWEDGLRAYRYFSPIK
jgi:hypothetical protein